MSSVDPQAREHAQIEQAETDLAASVESPTDWRITLDHNGNLRALHDGPGETSIMNGDMVWDGETWQLTWGAP